MFDSSTLIRFPLRLILVFIISFVAVASALAQGVGSSRGLPGGEGRHMIKGRVFNPSGRPVEAGMKIRLEGQGDAAGSKRRGHRLVDQR